MCEPASFVLTKDSIFWSMHTDSHEDIIEEYGLHADGRRGPNVLRVEITPPDEDMTQPPRKWVYRVDQDILPSWADSNRDEKRTRKALCEWKRKRVFTSGTHTIKSGSVFAYDDATVYAYDSAIVDANGSATVNARRKSTVYARGKSTVDARGSATVHAYGRSTVDVYDSATVYAFGRALVYAYDRSTVDARGSATVHAYSRSTVDVYDSATVYAYVKSNIIRYGGDVTLHDDAQMIDRG